MKKNGLLSIIDSTLVSLSELCSFGRGLRLLPFETRVAAILQVRTTLGFAFFPLFLGLFVAILIDQAINATFLVFFDIFKSGEVFSVSVALLAPVWLACRDESNMKNKGSFMVWVTVVMLASTVALTLPRVHLQVRTLLFIVLALGVLILTITLSFATSALYEGVAGGSVGPSLTEEDEFSATFQKQSGA